MNGAGSGADADGGWGELGIGGVERAVVDEMNGVGREEQLRNLNRERRGAMGHCGRRN